MGDDAAAAAEIAVVVVALEYSRSSFSVLVRPSNVDWNMSRHNVAATMCSRRQECHTQTVVFLFFWSRMIYIIISNNNNKCIRNRYFCIFFGVQTKKVLIDWKKK